MSDPLIHPPWRTIAEGILRAKDPELYREMKGPDLQRYLDLRVESARSTYEHLVKRLVEQNPGQESWALQAAQEMVVRDVLDPTT